MNLKINRKNGSTRLILMLFCMIMVLFSVAAQSPAKTVVLQIQETQTPALLEKNTEQTPETIEMTLTLTAIPTNTPTATPFPDWAMTSKDTNGLLISGMLILFIIIVGTLTAMTKNIPHPQNKEK